MVRGVQGLKLLNYLESLRFGCASVLFFPLRLTRMAYNGLEAKGVGQGVLLNIGSISIANSESCNNITKYGSKIGTIAVPNTYCQVVFFGLVVSRKRTRA